MSGLYDRLQNQLGNDDDDKSSGITPLDIADLPEQQRRVMLTLLRDPRSTSDGATEETLVSKFGRTDELFGTLDELINAGWLISMGEPPRIRYKINLRRKRGSSGSMWASLTDYLNENSDNS